MDDTVTGNARPPVGRQVVGKLPQITLAFWIMKIAATTLGETAGDLLAQTMQVGYLGFAGGALLISGLLALVVIAKYLTTVSTTLLFWIAFVLTRPLGATTGDFFSQPVAKGGLGYGTVGASLILAAVLLALIAHQARRSPAIP